MGRQKSIAFLFIGGLHQAPHIAPLAATLAQRADIAVTAYAVSASDAAALKVLLSRLGGHAIAIEVLEVPIWARLLLLGHGGKVLRLILNRSRLSRHDVLVAAERTSTILKRLPGRAPLMVHVPHGAGDRAKGFERRIALFDHVITAGEKDRRRLIAAGLVDADRCSCSGSLKLEAMLRLQPERPARPFADRRPIILYNPHFDRRLSSWSRFGWSLAEAVLADGRYNLIVAPHVRLAQRLSRAERSRWQSLAASDRLIVDFGSARSMDMTHVRVADVYLGDVSSQVYEFLADPRPAIFIDAHHADWRDDPDYLMWKFGAVCRSEAEVMAALDAAAHHPAAFSAAHCAGVRDALGQVQGASARAAEQLLAVLARHSGPDAVEPGDVPSRQHHSARHQPRPDPAFEISEEA